MECDISSFLFSILEEVYEVATGNLYGGYLSVYTETPLIQIIEKLKSRNIALPAIEPFAISRASEEHGWESPIAKSAFFN